MKKPDFNAMQETCDRYDTLIKYHLNEMLDTIVDEYYFKKFANAINRYKHAADTAPENWYEFCLMQYTAGKIFCENGTYQKFFKKSKINHLPEYEQEMIGRFRDTPWFYSVFMLSESYGNDFFKIFDVARQKFFMLHSEAITKIYDHDNQIYMALVFDNGDCLQTYGIIHQYSYFIKTDFEYFTEMLDPGYESGDNFAKIIEKSPLPYYILDFFADMLLPGQESGHFLIYISEWECDEFDYHLFEKDCIIENKGGIYQCIVKNHRLPPPHLCEFYYNNNTKELLINATTEKAYEKAVAVVQKYYPVDSEPEWVYTLQITLAVKKILKKELVMQEYQALFSAHDESHSEELNKLNQFVRKSTDAYNTGENIDIEELAASMGIPLETAQMLTDKLAISSTNDFFEGGIPGFKTPPPAYRDVFASPFTTSDFFDLIPNKEIQELINDGLTAQEIEPVDIIRASEIFAETIASSFEDVFESTDHTILQYTIYLLLKKGSQFHYADDYVIEVLRAFGHLYISGQDTNETQEFFDIYKYDLLLSVLWPTGLIETHPDDEPEDDNFRIKTTKRFTDWIKLRPGVF